MKKNLYIVVVFLFLFEVSFIFPQETSKIDSLFSFFPAKVGDKWFYKVLLTSRIDNGSSILYSSREIVKDTMINNFIFNKIINLLDVYSYKEKSITYERLDSTSGKLFLLDYHYGQEAEIISDFSMKYKEMYSNGPKTLQFMGNTDRIFMNQIIKAKTFYYQRYFVFRSFTYYEKIGLGNYSWYVDFTDALYSIVWCKLNGVYYGDTLQTKISNNNEIPSEFNLYQNYPNPFNPTTKITFTTPKSNHTTLEVFDVIGRIVTTVVNQYLNDGKYQIDYDNNLLTSGIYFYRLRSGDYISTKKMITIK